MQTPPQESGATLALPRPIPEPVPVDEPGFPWFALAIVFAGALIVSGLILAMLRSRKPAVISSSKEKPEPQAAPLALTPIDRTTPEGAAAQIRAWFAQRFGPAWLARTTESITKDPLLLESVDPEVHALIIQLLMDSDRHKFCPPPDSAQVETISTQARLAHLERIESGLFPKGSGTNRNAIADSRTASS